VSQEFLNPSLSVEVDRLRITQAVRSVVFEMRYAPTLSRAVEALDMACYDDLVDREEVAQEIARIGAMTGVRQAREALVHGDENVWSPQESRMRGLWTRIAGLASPLCNRPVFSRDGRLIGTPDVIDPILGLLGHYNGRVHLVGTQHAQDLRKEEAFRAVGLEPITMVAEDWADVDDFVRRLHAAAERAQRRAREPRAWTVEPPSWWTPTWTVAQRRALDAEQRLRWLGYRPA
jgi:hypothetical protein